MAAQKIGRGALVRRDLVKSFGGAFSPSALRVALRRGFVVQVVDRAKG